MQTRETVADFLARGGKIQRVPSETADDPVTQPRWSTVMRAASEATSVQAVAVTTGASFAPGCGSTFARREVR